MMDRLTGRDSNGNSYLLIKKPKKYGFENETVLELFEDAIERLAYYEDLKEAGRLVELPCKIGDTVYCIYNGKVIQGTVRLIRPFISKERIIFKGNIICEVDDIFFNDGRKEEIKLFVVFINPYVIERVAYLTKEEAEVALKERKAE